MLTDPISDYLNRIRNALLAEHEEVEIPASGLKREMSRILKEQGYITDFSVEPGRVGEVIKVRNYSRCNRCGRPRAVFRKFGLCRICLRELAHQGAIPGMTKSSW